MDAYEGRQAKNDMKLVIFKLGPPSTRCGKFTVWWKSHVFRAHPASWKA